MGRRRRRRRWGRLLREGRIALERMIPIPIKDVNPVTITREELEALRLVYYEEKTLEEAAKVACCSKSKMWRLVKSGRKKLVAAIVEGRPIVVEG